MARLFRNNTQGQVFSERQLLENRYQSYRHEIIFVVLCTVINAVLLLTNADTYFLFSAYVPYFMITMGMMMCGKFPAEYYEDLDGMELLDDSFLVVMCVLAAIGIGIYVLCWFMAKKRVGWLVAALVLISLDTIAIFLLAGIDMTMILDYIFHGLIIYSLVMGIITDKKLKALPEEDELTEVIAEEAVAVEEETSAK